MTTKVCMCGKVFAPRKHNQIHCSEKCRIAKTVKDCREDLQRVKAVAIKVKKGMATYAELKRATKNMPRLVAYSRRVMGGGIRI